MWHNQWKSLEVVGMVGRGGLRSCPNLWKSSVLLGEACVFETPSLGDSQREREWSGGGDGEGQGFGRRSGNADVPVHIFELFHILFQIMHFLKYLVGRNPANGADE